MVYQTVTIKEARNNFAELIERAALAGDAFLVTKFGKPKALIISSSGIVGKNITEAKSARERALKETKGMWRNRKDMRETADWVDALGKRLSSRHGKIFS